MGGKQSTSRSALFGFYIGKNIFADIYYYYYCNACKILELWLVLYRQN